MPEFAKPFAKYMPLAKFPEKKGCALQCVTIETKSGVKRFLIEMAPQVKPKPPSGSTASPFSWENKIKIALKEEEVGAFMATLRRRSKQLSVIHKYPIDAPKETQRLSTLKIEERMNQGICNWQLRLSQKVGLGEAQAYTIYLQPSDAEILMVLLEDCIKRMYDVS